jgi:hypothetical protein
MEDTAVASVAACFSREDVTDASSELTTYEFMSSGLLRALVNWLVSNSEKTGYRIMLLRKHFLETAGAAPGKKLLRHLHELVSRSDVFPRVSPLSTENPGRSAYGESSDLLARHIRLRVQPDEKTGQLLGEKQGYASFTVSVHSVTEVSGLEDYIFSKISAWLPALKRDSETPNKNNKQPSSADSDQVQQHTTATSGSAENSTQSAQAFAVSRQFKSANDANPSGTDNRIRHDSSFVHDVDAEDGALGISRGRTVSSSAIASGEDGKKTGVYRVRLRVGTHTVPSQTTIYAMLHRYETENVWRKKIGVVDAEAEQAYSATSQPGAQPSLARVSATSSNEVVDVFTNRYTLLYTVDGGESTNPGASVQASDFAEKFTPEILRPRPTLRREAAGQNDRETISRVTSVPNSMAALATTDCVLAMLLIRVLYQANQSLESGNAARLPDTFFQNAKLTTKLNRQLADILVSSCNLLPAWTFELCNSFTCLLPYETRLRFLQTAYFGSNRVLMVCTL